MEYIIEILIAVVLTTAVIILGICLIKTNKKLNELKSNSIKKYERLNARIDNVLIATKALTEVVKTLSNNTKDLLRLQKEFDDCYNEFVDKTESEISKINRDIYFINKENKDGNKN